MILPIWLRLWGELGSRCSTSGSPVEHMTLIRREDCGHDATVPRRTDRSGCERPTFVTSMLGAESRIGYQKLLAVAGGRIWKASSTARCG
jgi:hypothetical protein